MLVRLLFAAATLFCFASAGAHDVSRHTAPSQVAAGTDDTPVERAARLFFSDRRLVTQEGRDVAFYSDVLKDRVVLVNLVFTHCEDACPTQSVKVAAVQALVGASEPTLRFVSISVDPERDTPDALAQYAANFRAGPNWTFLTGKQERRRRSASPTRPVDDGSRVAHHAFSRGQRGDRSLAPRARRCHADVHCGATAIACGRVGEPTEIARGNGRRKEVSARPCARFPRRRSTSRRLP
jgi:cytochrome oxidase Cu insertion factor (SCO1/SenC/PrrC family)